ncbi:hypothetical protein [Heyndrickxia coagulans]|uniref:hypothetical protein n=1 Tax=Heyndrickxia coagulans TaxID=1398 RepID=UPI003F59E271
MAKKKRRRRKKAAEQIKIDLKFELLGIILLTLGIFTLYHIGKTGTTLILFFRFFFGRLYWVAVASLVVLSVFLMIKRAWPAFFTVRMTGFYLLFASALLYCHERLIGSLAKAHELSGNSAVVNTIRIWHQEEQIWWKLVLGGMCTAIFSARRSAAAWQVRFYMRLPIFYLTRRVRKSFAFYSRSSP